MTWAMVFPGQGSQSIGMLHPYEGLPEVRRAIDTASAVLDQDIWRLVADGPEESLMATINTQPVMLAAGVGVYRAWRGHGGAEPNWLAGHSLGEYTALVVAESISFEEALRLVRFRAEVMQEAVPAGIGAMAALLGLEDGAVLAACQEAAQGEVVEAVNFNSPGQVVIAGHRTAVARAIDEAKARGAKRAVMLSLSVPSHCSLMKPAAERLAHYLEGVPLTSPRIPVLHNAEVVQATTPMEIRTALTRQLHHPVRWVDTIRAFARNGCTRVAECGPGKVLAPLVRRIDAEMEGIALNSAEALQGALS
ncbi:ACP S-malonyltransferase [Ferrovum sp.]|uniref:ACP S-malonyltransferase n=1 Tax=Ferrovum sp. TaxID=2609467 RepID=UPI0026051871|nr:ACP S-malonyltransferase [Ferrovum sp.]